MNYKHTKFACNTASIVSAIVNNFAPLLFVIFSKTFNLSVSQLAFIITMNFGTQIIVDFLGAKYVDKLGYRTVILISQSFCAIGLVGMGVLPYIIPAYTGILISVLIYAIGSALIEVITSPIIEALPSDSKSGSLSMLHSFFCWGSVFVIVVSTALFRIFGVENWRYITYFWALIPAFNTLLFAKVPIVELKSEKESHILKLFSNKVMWIFMLIMMCSGAAELAMSQWASYFAETALGVSKTVGDLLGPCSFAVFMGISRILYGLYSSKIDLKKFMIGSAVLCIISYLITALAKNSFVSMLGCGLCGFSVGIMWPGALSLASKANPLGGAPMFAIMALFGDFGCVFGPELMAQVSEKFTIHGSGMKAGFLVATVFPAIMIFAVLAGVRKVNKTQEKSQS